MWWILKASCCAREMGLMWLTSGVGSPNLPMCWQTPKSSSDLKGPIRSDRLCLSITLPPLQLRIPNRQYGLRRFAAHGDGFVAQRRHRVVAVGEQPGDPRTAVDGGEQAVVQVRLFFHVER